MTNPVSDYETAIAAIRQARLPHPDNVLLETFLDEAVDRDRAAAFLLKWIDTNANTFRASTGAFLADWKRTISIFVRDGGVEAPNQSAVSSVTRRDGAKCCITGTQGSFWDPLVVVSILPRPNIADIKTGPSREMLEAFLTPKLTDRLISHAATESSFDSVENYWLLRKSAAVAFAQGYFQLSFTSTRKPKYEVLKVERGLRRYPPILDRVADFRPGRFVDHSLSEIDIPNRWALEIVSRFAVPLRWTYIAQEIASRQQETEPKSSPTALSLVVSPISSLLSNAFAAIFETAWRLVPGKIRIRIYRSFVFLGVRMYGPSDSSKVQRLPFGLYLKATSVIRRESLVNEHAALELVRQHTDIPVPRALDLVSDLEYIYLLTTRIPGYKLGLFMDTISDADAAALVRELRRHIITLRAIPKPIGWKHAICNAAGGPCFDYRIHAALDYDEERGEVVGPFLSEDEFIETLRCGALPGVVHRDGHEMVFTHGDLNMRNVLVDDHGRLTGIVDWENAGWFPEYWDYTKAYFVTRLNQRWLRMIDEVFEQFGDFRQELATERELWNYCF